MLPHLPSATAPGYGGVTDVTASIEITPNGGADFTRAFPGYKPALGGKYRRPSAKLKSVFLAAQLFPGYASATVLKHGQSVQVKSTSTATLTFANVPIGNNEWTIVDMYLVGKDGSTIYIGSEAALVNVTKRAAVIKTTAATTQLFQAAMTLIGAGLITAQDLSDKTLSATIAAQIKSAGLTPDASTGLFSATQLALFVQTELPEWQRVLTIDGGSAAREISIANDTTNVAEANAFSNMTQANLFTNLNVPPLSTYRPAGAPCGQTFPAHVPGKAPSPVQNTCATVFGTSTGKITFPVYGDSILVGASNGSPPYTGVSQIVPARSPGDNSKITLGALQASQINVATTDPFDWAFGTTPALAVTNASALSSTLRVRANYYAGFSYNAFHPVEFSVPSTYSSSSATIPVNTWNPFGLSAGSFQFCTAWAVCQALTSSSTFTIVPPFADPGSDLAYFNWTGSPITTSGGCKGYIVTPSANAASITTTTPTVLVAGQQLTIQFGQKKGCGAPSPAGSLYPPAGSVVQVEAVDGSGITYIGQAITAAPLGSVSISMDTYLPVTQISSVTVSLTSPSTYTGPLQIGTISSAFTP